MPKTITCHVIEVIQRTPDVKSFRVRPVEHADYQAGQFMTVTLDVDGKRESKYLTISNSPSEGFLEFTKKITDSPFSKALNRLKPGDELSVSMPMGRFTLDRAGDKIAFLSGGIGITPIRCISQEVSEKGLDKDIVVIDGNRTWQDIAFRDEFDRMSEKNSRFRIIHVLDCPPEEWKGYRGYITKDIIIKEIPDYQERTFFLCGPPQMVKVLSSLLSESLLIPKERIVIENFAGY